MVADLILWCLQVDLTGGYYDAGDNVKFGLPMAFSITLLSWNAMEYRTNLRQTRQLGHTLNAIRWGTDYLLKCNTGPQELWVQVRLIDRTPQKFRITLLKSAAVMIYDVNR